MVKAHRVTRAYTFAVELTEWLWARARSYGSRRGQVAMLSVTKSK